MSNPPSKTARLASLIDSVSNVTSDGPCCVIRAFSGDDTFAVAGAELVALFAEFLGLVVGNKTCDLPTTGIKPMIDPVMVPMISAVLRNTLKRQPYGMTFHSDHLARAGTPLSAC